jgi:hypothetical protein
MLGSLPITATFSGKHFVRMIRGRVTRRLLAVALSAVGLLACCSVTSFIRSGGGVGVADGPGRPKVRLAWRASTGALRSSAFASNGRFLCTVKPDGTLSVYSSSGTRRFSARIPGATDAVVTGDARYTLAYSRRNPANSTLVFLDATGAKFWQTEVDGAVWSADACATPGGARFAVGTGRNYVYIIDLGENRRRYRRWRAPGAVSSVALVAGGDEVIYATWQRSVIGRATVRGRKTWENSTEPCSIHYVQVLGSEDRILARAVPYRPGADGVYTLLSGAGDVISRGALPASENARVLVAPNGRYVCVGTDRLIRHKGKCMRERHAMLLDDSGRVLCDKGSPFFRAEPVHVTSAGYVLLMSDRQELFTLSPTGRLSPALKTSAPMTHGASSRDGSRLLFQSKGGSLLMVSASHNDAAAVQE